MLRNYLIVAFRNILKNKIYSILNIFGLAIGMAACFFIFQYVNFESGYDRSYKEASRIYRVPISYTGSFSNIPTTAANHPAVGPAMKAEFPEVKDFTRLVNISLFTNGSTMSYKPSKGEVRSFNEEKIFLADKSFFNIFTHPFLEGSSAASLSKANSIVLTQSMAKKYFSNTEPMGQTLYLNGDLILKVTGVIKDWPENSHLRINMLISFITLSPEWGYDNWKFPEFYNYVLLAPGTDPKKVEAKFPAFINKHLGDIMKEFKFGCSFNLQAVPDIHLTSNYLKEAETNASEREISFLSIIGVFILLIAWINYINLSTAKSMERAKEVGLRKVVGAAKSQLIMQFLMESVLVNLIALFFAIGFIFLSIPYLQSLTGKDFGAGFFSSGLGSTGSFWILALLIFVAGALLVGAYPALILSSFRPALVLKGLIASSSKGISLRKVLVSFQFILSIILIAATLIVSLQLKYMQNGDLGYKKEQVLIVKTPAIGDSTIRGKYGYFKSEALKNPAVLNVSTSSDIPGNNIRYRNSVRRANQDKTSNFTTYLLEMDDNFIPTYDVTLVGGRNFYKNESELTFKEKNTKVLINEEVAKALGYTNPADAVNKFIVFQLGADDVYSEVIGVTKNYHQRSFKEKYDPILSYFPPFTDWKYFSVKINVKNLNSNLTGLENLYKSTFPGNPFEYFFLDSYFNEQYQSDQRLAKVFGLFTVLAIVVAGLGLLGLSSFVIKMRTREIGIRKVLGASISSILVLFSKDFVKLVVIASLIAIPLIFFAADKWLANFAFHISLNVLIFIIPPILLLMITLITICLQSLKAALSNPVKSLRSE
jgi:putative ABC transport system permease protein